MTIARISRRRFLHLAGVAGTGLILGACTPDTRVPKRGNAKTSMNAFVEIGHEGQAPADEGLSSSAQAHVRDF